MYVYFNDSDNNQLHFGASYVYGENYNVCFSVMIHVSLWLHFGATVGVCFGV